MTKKHLPIIARAVFAILTIIGLFCVLTGCESLFRKATETTGSLLPPTPPETESTPEPEETGITETETQKSPETEPVIEPKPIENTENTPSAEAAEWISRCAQSGDPDSVILDGSGIAALNEKIRSSCPTMHNMEQIPESIPGGEIADRIRNGKPPVSQKYDRDGKPIYKDQIDRMEENKNLSAIPDIIIPQTGIVTSRANIRTIPTTVNFFDETDKKRHYDRIQEAELVLGTPVWMLHESLDGLFWYIRSYYYEGWVEKTSIAAADRDTYEKYLPGKNNAVVCITAAFAELSDGRRLDMGAVFPFLSDTEDSFIVEIPGRDETGAVTAETAELAKSEARYGYLPYTMANFYTQAFKFTGTAYSWGGFNEGVDCSGFVCAVFRSFGIYLPRNTGEQKDHAGTVTSLSGLDAAAVKSTLGRLSYPTAIHRPGHVMLYLGTMDGKIYVIHAPQGGQSVGVMELTKLDNLICAATVYADFAG